MKKPWPGMMIAAVTISWLSAGGLAVESLIGMWLGYSMMGGDTESFPIIAGFGQIFGSMILVWALTLAIPAAALCIVSGLVQGRWPWSRIVYSVVAAGLGVTMFVAHSGSPLFINSMGWIAVPVIAATVLMWMPSSRPFFVRRRRQHEQLSSVEGPSQEPVLVEDWPQDILLPPFDGSPQQSDSGFQRIKPDS